MFEPLAVFPFLHLGASRSVRAGMESAAVPNIAAIKTTNADFMLEDVADVPEDWSNDRSGMSANLLVRASRWQSGSFMLSSKAA